MSPNNNTGKLQVNVVSAGNSRPIPDARVSISFTGEPNSTIEELTTDSSGQTETIDLESPPLEYSLNPTIEIQP